MYKADKRSFLTSHFDQIQHLKSSVNQLAYSQKKGVYIMRFILIFLLSLSAFAENKKPNILFCIADDASLDFGAYGCTWTTTPAFDRVAKEGLLFNRAYTPNAKCAPSRAIILTGRYSWQLEQAGNHMAIFPAKFKGFVEALGENGYQTGYTGKGWGPGIAEGRQLAGKSWSKRKLKSPASGISSNDYAANFKDFHTQRDKSKPWFFWYGTTEPHRGFEFKSGVNKNNKKLSDIPRVPAYWPDTETVRHDMLDYGFEVEHYDRHLGLIIKQLEESGDLENTLIIVTSDHGRPFPRMKGQCYEDSNHIPFAVMWKGKIQGGHKIDDYVNFTDIVPTVLEAAGLTLEQAGMQPLSGKSLFPVFTADKSGRIEAWRDHVVIGKERHDVGRPNNWGYPTRGIIKDAMLFLENYEIDRWPAGNPETGYLNCDGGPTKSLILEMRRNGGDTKFWDLCFGKRPQFELYNIAKDSDCVINLAGNPEYAAKMKELKTFMNDKLSEQKDPRMEGKGDIFDSYLIHTPKMRDFYENFMKGKAPKAGWVKASDFEKEPVK